MDLRWKVAERCANDAMARGDVRGYHRYLEEYFSGKDIPQFEVILAEYNARQGNNRGNQQVVMSPQPIQGFTPGYAPYPSMQIANLDAPTALAMTSPRDSLSAYKRQMARDITIAALSTRTEKETKISVKEKKGFLDRDDFRGYEVRFGRSASSIIGDLVDRALGLS